MNEFILAILLLGPTKKSKVQPKAKPTVVKSIAVPCPGTPIPSKFIPGEFLISTTQASEKDQQFIHCSTEFPLLTNDQDRLKFLDSLDIALWTFLEGNVPGMPTYTGHQNHFKLISKEDSAQYYRVIPNQPFMDEDKKNKLQLIVNIPAVLALRNHWRYSLFDHIAETIMEQSR